MTNGHPPASGARIFEAIERLGAQLTDKFVRDQRHDQNLEQIRLSVDNLTSAVQQLQNVVRSEAEHTRRALLIFMSTEGLEGLERERGGNGG